MLLTLFILRNKQQAYFQKTSSEITELMDLLQHTHDYSEYFTSFSVSRPCEETETERAYFNYFFYCFFQIKSLFDKKQEIGFIFHKQNLICRQVGQLMTYLTQQFPLNHLENKIPIYFYFLVLAVVFSNCWVNPAVVFLHFAFQKPRPIILVLLYRKRN